MTAVVAVAVGVIGAFGTRGVAEDAQRRERRPVVRVIESRKADEIETGRASTCGERAPPRIAEVYSSDLNVVSDTSAIREHRLVAVGVDDDGWRVVVHCEVTDGVGSSIRTSKDEIGNEATVCLWQIGSGVSSNFVDVGPRVTGCRLYLVGRVATTTSIKTGIALHGFKLDNRSLPEHCISGTDIASWLQGDRVRGNEQEGQNEGEKRHGDP